jgi:Flp pilus assembly pilin Flp
MRDLILRFAADETGNSAIEYLLVASIMAVAIVGMAGTVGMALIGKLDEILQALMDAGR